MHHQDALKEGYAVPTAGNAMNRQPSAVKPLGKPLNCRELPYPHTMIDGGKDIKAWPFGSNME